MILGSMNGQGKDQYLVQAVRDILSRDRLKENRDRIARMHAGKFSVPAEDQSSRHRSPGPSGGKALCFNFQKTGKCKFGDKCRCQHARGTSLSTEAPGQAVDKAVLAGDLLLAGRCLEGEKGKDKSKIPCRFFKSGKCKRGDSCPFMHESAPAAAPTRRYRDPSPSRKRANSTSDRSQGRSQGRGRDKNTERRSKDEEPQCISKQQIKQVRR